MTLRKQLLLLGLLLLCLPWAGCQYLRGVDQALRATQAQQLTEIGRTFVGLLRSNLNPEDFENVTSDWQVMPTQSINRELVIDGYAQDWRDALKSNSLQEMQFEAGIESENKLLTISVSAATFKQQTFFLLKTNDQTQRFFNPALSDLFEADHFLLKVFDASDRAQLYYLTASSPGRIMVQQRRADGRLYETSDVIGYWQTLSSGHQIELSVRSEILKNGFDFEVVDIGPSPIKSVWLAKSLGENKKGFIPVGFSKEIQNQIDALAFKDFGLYVFNQQGVELAQRKIIGNDTFASSLPWLLDWFYRRVLLSNNLPEYSANEQEIIFNSVNPSSHVQWFKIADPIRPQVLGRLWLPVEMGGDLQGYLLLEQTTDQLRNLTGAAFNRFFLFSLFAVGAIVILLLLYASWLSWRVLRINKAAAAVIADPFAPIDPQLWPDIKSHDELGVLSRNYQQLLAQMQDYHRYLRSLASQLSHELRTPIAIIRSSLDNLAFAKNDEERERYQQRAQQGLERLNTILTAMSSVNRFEDGLSDAEFIDVDLVGLTQQLVDIYREIHPRSPIIFSCDEAALTYPIAQDLWAQMLDKIFDNAMSFSPEGETVGVSLEKLQGQVVLKVANVGPLLPDVMQTELFEPLVSVRDSRKKAASHLGLGLYLVRLVVELHKGQVDIANQSDGSGVVITIRLPA